MRRFSFVLVLLLGGCQGVGGLSAGDGLLLACRGYGGALEQLALLRSMGRLDASEVAAVNSARLVLNPLCLNTPADLADALRLVEREMLILISMELKNGKDG